MRGTHLRLDFGSDMRESRCCCTVNQFFIRQQGAFYVCGALTKRINPSAFEWSLAALESTMAPEVAI